MTNNTEDRLIQLEIINTEQEMALQDLSDMVNRQWQEIEKLQARLSQTHQRIISLEEHMPSSTGAEKPPHY